MKTYRTKAELAFAELRSKIARGDFQPGHLVSQRDVARELGMSITPVREALRRLEAEGLLLGGSHTTLRVRDVSVNDVVRIYRLRGVLEGYATSEAAHRLSPTVLRRLGELYREMLSASRTKRFHRYRSLDEEFHMLIYRSVDNAYLTEVIADLWIKYPRDVLWTISGRIERSVNEHGAILKALKSQDARAGGRLMQRHIENSMQEIVEYLSRREMGMRQEQTAKAVGR